MIPMVQTQYKRQRRLSSNKSREDIVYVTRRRLQSFDVDTTREAAVMYEENVVALVFVIAALLYYS